MPRYASKAPASTRTAANTSISIDMALRDQLRAMAADLSADTGRPSVSYADVIRSLIAKSNRTRRGSRDV